MFGVELVDQRVRVFTERCSEDNYFIQLSHLFQELLCIWSD